MSIDLEQHRLSQVARQNILLRRPAEIGPTIDEDGQPVLDAGMAPSALQALGVPVTACTGTFGSSRRNDASSIKGWWTSCRKGVELVPLAIAGYGASYVAGACARSAIMRQMAFGWMHWGDYITDRLASIDDKDRESIEERHAEHERRRTVYQLLVIEGFSLRSLKDFMVDEVLEMLTTRDRNGLITLITTSADEEDYVARLDESITVRAPLVRWLQDEASWSSHGGE